MVDMAEAKARACRQRRFEKEMLDSIYPWRPYVRFAGGFVIGMLFAHVAVRFVELVL